ncbi:MAG TPA: hypothetical protein VN452_03790 [Longilinea sp.]|nr:hypothetical protein [Longilinea sp.]
MQDINYLIYGNPTSLLLKSDSSAQPARLTYESPYWFWMRPAYVNRSGWFSKQHVHSFLAKLDTTESRLNKFSSKEFGTRWGYVTLSIPEGQLEYLNYAKIGYGSAKRMLEFAFQNNQDLYLVISD